MGKREELKTQQRGGVGGAKSVGGNSERKTSGDKTPLPMGEGVLPGTKKEKMFSPKPHHYHNQNSEERRGNSGINSGTTKNKVGGEDRKLGKQNESLT